MLSRLFRRGRDASQAAPAVRAAPVAPAAPAARAISPTAFFFSDRRVAGTLFILSRR
jgi:hypothetical protein